MSGPGSARSTAGRDEGLRAHVVVDREHFTVDIALTVGAGETVAVMGPSGAGKSTLLQAVAGLEPVRDGEIAIGGRVVDRSGAGGVSAPRVTTAPMHRGIVLLGQEPRLFPHLSVRENVAFGPRAQGVDARTARADADDRLARVGLAGAGDRHPRELSGGEQQRVAVARALAAAPRAVLLDEPLVALDPDTAGGIRRMLREQLCGITTVAVTHDAADAVALADRLIVVERGRVTQDGPVRAVLAAPASAFVASSAGVNRLVGVAEQGGWSGSGARIVSADPDARARAASDGTALAAVFRPSDVQVARDGDADAPADSWPAVVTAVEPTLTGLRLHTTVGVADVPATVRSEPGDRVRLRVDPAQVRFVPVG